LEEKIFSVVTERGQITIPARIRNEYKIMPGDKLAYITDDNENIKIKVIKQTSLDDVFGIFEVDSVLPFEKERENAQEYLKRTHGRDQDGEK
jgi:AbrB family looped-hinge helix DNA binding protein